MAKTNKTGFLTDTLYSFGLCTGGFAFVEQSIIHHLPKISAPCTGAGLELVLLSANRIKLDTLYSLQLLLPSLQKFRQLRGQVKPQKEKMHNTTDCESHKWRLDKGIRIRASGAHVFTNMESIEPNSKYDYRRGTLE